MNFLTRIFSRSPAVEIEAVEVRLPTRRPNRNLPDRMSPASVKDQSWLYSPAIDATPSQVRFTLQSAPGGDLGSQWDLFAHMQDTWPRLRKNLHELRSAVASTRWKVMPADDSDRARQLADDFATTLTRWAPVPGSDENGWEDMLYDLTDAFVTGSSVQEILWQQDGAGVFPRAAVWVHPRHLRVTEAGWIVPQFGTIPEKFVVATHKGCTGSATKAGVLRPLAWWWCAQHFGAKWLLKFSEIFGQPFRWATYAPNTPQAVIDTLGTLLADMGASGYATMPEGVKIEFKEAIKDGTNNPQAVLLALADKQCDILILGQTLTTDVGASGSRALGDVHEDVREERISQLARWAADQLNYQLVPAWCRLNYGTDDLCPVLTIDDTETPDPDKMAERIGKARGLGIEVPVKWAREQLGIPEPEDGEDVLPAPMAQPSADLGMGNAETTQAAVAAVRGMPSLIGDFGVRTIPTDPTDPIVARKAEALAKVFRGSLAPVRAAVMDASSPEEALARVQAWYADWSPERAAAVVNEAMQIAAAAGTGGNSQ